MDDEREFPYGSEEAKEEVPAESENTAEENTEEPTNEETEQPAEDQGKGVSSDLIRGHINTIILRALYDGDKYGYEIIAEIERKSHGQYELKQPSLYSALKRLEKDGYITSYWGGSVGGGRRKYFSLTDAGKEIAEQNQSEWEYSRTIIDSLISDKDFDFSNPAPTAVNMRVLKSTTSRVPAGEGEDEGDFEFEPIYDDSADREKLVAEYEEKLKQLDEEKTAEYEEKLRKLEEEKTEEYNLKAQQLEEVHSAEREELDARAEAIEEEKRLIEEERERNEQILREREAREQELLRSESMLREENAKTEALLEEERRRYAESLAEQEIRIRDEMEADFRRREKEILHQNYLNLVNTPPTPSPDAPYYVAPEEPAPPAEPEPAPVREETGYRAVLGKVYSNAIPRSGENGNEPERAQDLSGIDFTDLEARAAHDGIRVVTSGSGNVGRNPDENIVHKGKALFLSSLVVFFYCIVIGAIAMGIRKSHGISLFLPWFIWGMGTALLLVTGLAFANRFGERSLKRKSPAILNAIVVYALLVIVTLIVALACNIDFASGPDLENFVVFPVVFLAGVLLFGVTYFVQVNDFRK